MVDTSTGEIHIKLLHNGSMSKRKFIIIVPAKKSKGIGGSIEVEELFIAGTISKTRPCRRVQMEIRFRPERHIVMNSSRPSFLQQLDLSHFWHSMYKQPVLHSSFCGGQPAQPSPFPPPTPPRRVSATESSNALGAVDTSPVRTTKLAMKVE
jgi:hypothetical protein